MEELHNSFKPMLTPKQMLHKGIFGGTYFSQLVDYRAFPKDWFNNLHHKINCKSKTSLPYFSVQLSCVCLMFAYRKKIAYSYLKVT